MRLTFRRLGALLAGALVASVLVGLYAAGPAFAAPLTYELTAVGGVAIPGDGVTDLEPGAEGAPGRTLLLQPKANTAESTIRRPGGAPAQAPVVMADALMAAPVLDDTLLAEGVRLYLSVAGVWGGWQATLYDFDAADGSRSAIGRARVSTGAGEDVLELVFDNAPYTLSGGHRLALRVELEPAVGAGGGSDTTLVIGGPVREAVSRLVVDAAAGEDQTPRTLLTTTPAKPDGAEGWFITVPEISLTAVSPIGSGTTVYYAWDDEAPRVYAGPFTAPPGEHVLRFHAEDRHGHVEAERAQGFLVDDVLVPPVLQVEGGDFEGVSVLAGTTAMNVLAGDDGSRLVEVGVYRFPVEGGERAAAGHLLVGDTQPLEGQDGYRFFWNTATVSDGDYLLQAQARDLAGNLSWSAPWTIRVDNAAPSVALTSPELGKVLSLPYAVVGTVEDDSLVAWSIEVRPLGSDDWREVNAGQGTAPRAIAVLESGPSGPSLAPGSYQVRLRATDAAGNSAETDPLPFRIEG